MNQLHNSQHDTVLALVRCPDCSNRLVPVNACSYACTGCERRYSIDSGVIVLLPKQLDLNKQAEELTWQTHEHEGKDKPAWMALVHKRDEIFHFITHIQTDINPKGNVLEIGSGSCWASSLIKMKTPGCRIVASDVSPAALQKGMQVCSILGAIPDFFIACDVERLPFNDGSFDLCFGNAIIHHLSDTVMGMAEVYRVLKQGGIYIGAGELASGRLLSMVWRSKLGLAGKRGQQLGVNERIYTIDQWRNLFLQAGFKNVKIYFQPQWQHSLYHWFPPLYYRLIGNFPEVILRHMPCAIKITVEKD